MPKKLYRYSLDHCFLESHEFGLNCLPQKVAHNEFGELYRCKCPFEDFYGYFTKKAAKAEDTEQIKKEIANLNQILTKRGTPPRRVLK